MLCVHECECLLYFYRLVRISMHIHIKYMHRHHNMLNYHERIIKVIEDFRQLYNIYIIAIFITAYTVQFILISAAVSSSWLFVMS